MPKKPLTVSETSAKPPISLVELANLSVGELHGVGEKRQEDLKTMQITSLLDLVMHYPRRWVDRTNECRVEDLLPGVQALVVVEVLSVDKRMTRNRRSMITVRQSGHVIARPGERRRFNSEGRNLHLFEPDSGKRIADV